jgi:hypothetical protein
LASVASASLQSSRLEQRKLAEAKNNIQLGLVGPLMGNNNCIQGWRIANKPYPRRSREVCFNSSSPWAHELTHRIAPPTHLLQMRQLRSPGSHYSSLYSQISNK